MSTPTTQKRNTARERVSFKKSKQEASSGSTDKSSDMGTIIDWLTGKRRVEYKESRGLSLAIQTIEEFTGRTFKCPETTPKTSGIYREEILELIQEELPSYYDYTTRVKRYLNGKGIPQAQIEIMGSIGLSNRYNPLDRTFHIETESPSSLVPKKNQTEC